MWGLAVGMIGLGARDYADIIFHWHGIELQMRQGCSLPHSKLVERLGVVFTPASEKSILDAWIKFYYQKLGIGEKGSKFLSRKTL